MGYFLFCLLLNVVGLVMSYRAVPALVQGLRNQAPFEYNELGCPDARELFARFPNGLQVPFLWFVLTGKAYAVTHGSARVSAVFAWLGYMLTASGVIGVLILVLLLDHEWQ